MTTEQRIGATKQILAEMQETRNTSYNEHGYIGIAETDTEKALVQLLMICSNQEAEIINLWKQINYISKDESI